MQFTPLLLCKAVNTLGHLLPEVKHTADIRLGAGVRGYVYTTTIGGMAALWTTDHDVEKGLRRGPRLRAAFGQEVEYIDFMGNPRSAPPRDSHGYETIPLNAAPLYIRAADPDRLAAALQKAEVSFPK